MDAIAKMYFITKYMSIIIEYFVGGALPIEAGFGHSSRVAPRIPDPPEPSRPHMTTVRLSDGEKAQLERAGKLLAKRWKRASVGNADVIRVAIGMLLEELQREVSDEKDARA